MRVVLLAALAACGGSSSTKSPDAPLQVEIDAPTGGFTTCTGACMTTSYVATLASTRTLDHAFFYDNMDGTLQIEIHKGGDATCPANNSPSPDYTMVIGDTPIPTTTSPITPGGSSMLDFVGDLLANNAIHEMPSAISLTPVAYLAMSFIALDITATFTEGSAAGHVYATYCPTLAR